MTLLRCILILFLIFTMNIITDVSMADTMIAAQNCQTLSCVRKNIDQIDIKIIKLIGMRLSYVKRAGELKKNKSTIHDQARENRILLQVSRLAKKEGYSPKIAKEIFKSILLQSNIYEKQISKGVE